MKTLYVCDRCNSTHQLDQSKVKDKQLYVPPRSCYEGDYWMHYYYFFTCTCGRDIEVDKEHISSPLNLQENFTEHRGVCAITHQNNSTQNLTI